MDHSNDGPLTGPVPNGLSIYLAWCVYQVSSNLGAWGIRRLPLRTSVDKKPFPTFSIAISHFPLFDWHDQLVIISDNKTLAHKDNRRRLSSSKHNRNRDRLGRNGVHNVIKCETVRNKRPWIASWLFSSQNEEFVRSVKVKFIVYKIIGSPKVNRQKREPKL